MSATDNDGMSRPYTKEETRIMFLKQIRQHSEFWANLPDKTPQERCEGLVHALLAMIDGDVTGLPPFDIVARPIPGTTGQSMMVAQNYFQDGLVINDDCMLHELYFEQAP